MPADRSSDSFAQQLRQTFSNVGRPLTNSDGVATTDIEAAEARLGCQTPAPLRTFYTLAGNARDFLNVYDQFLLPHEWERHDDTLLFLVENQVVVLYGAPLGQGNDPQALMTSNDHPYIWHDVCEDLSTFLLVMLHWEATFGGAMAVCGSAFVDPSLRDRLDADLTFIGEVNGMRAYSQTGLAVCFVKWHDGWRIFAGAIDMNRLRSLESLGVAYE